MIPSRASKSAIAAIERVGGTVYCKYYNPLALGDCIGGRVDRIAAAPTKRKDIGVSTIHQQVAPTANPPRMVHPLGKPRLPLAQCHQEDAIR